MAPLSCEHPDIASVQDTTMNGLIIKRWTGIYQSTLLDVKATVNNQHIISKSCGARVRVRVIKTFTTLHTITIDFLNYIVHLH